MSMLEFKKRRRFKKRIYSRLSIFALLVLTFFLAKGAIGMFQKTLEAKAQYNQNSDQYEKLLKRSQDLESDLEYISSELGQEEELRKKFNVAKDGEEVITIIDSSGPQEPEKKGFWESIFD